MNKLLKSYLVPHPPIIVPEIGMGEERNARNTIEAMEEIADSISRDKPDSIILITPHGPVFSDAIAVGVQEMFRGTFGRFGKPDLSLALEGNLDLTFRIMEEAAREGIAVVSLDSATSRRYGINTELDHGALVPLYFVNRKYTEFKLVHITYGMLPNLELYRFGNCAKKAVESGNERVSIVCSGDLSHRLKKGAPAGYSERGREFDEKLVMHIKNMDTPSIIEMDESLVEEAGECGYRSVLILFGILDGYDVDVSVLSYEGPFGVGYCVAEFLPGRRNLEREYINILESRGKSKMQKVRENEDVYVRLARKALETYITEGRVIGVPEGLPPEMTQRKAGVFVSIKKNGKLRGCIGTISAATGSISEEIIHNAISAGTKDPRFYQVEDEELNELVYSVDVLAEPEPVDTIEQLDAKRYGVIVKSGRRSGLLLPDLEGVETPEDQVRIALQKAGINVTEPYTLERFEVIRHR
ncbi:MAG: hypothetical protein HPY66_2802 [Firmicutes bacterium]|nr:hypothetical protein [Bacillota bacterium]MDI6705921.1 AmmeMemoRadiSam system protein A [Bacillota bacterium]